MMLIFTLLSLLFLPILSLKEIKPKLCINSKYIHKQTEPSNNVTLYESSLFKKARMDNI